MLVSRESAVERDLFHASSDASFASYRLRLPTEGLVARLGEIEADSPAAAAGLQEGDIVTKVDDDQVIDATGLTAAIRGNAPGDTVTITYQRDGDEQTTEVTLGTLPAG